MGRAILLAALLINPLYASDLLGPILFPAGEHKGEGVALDYKIEYLDPWGHTVADDAGLHFCHDRLAPGYCSIANAPEDRLAAKYWGSYPLYYSGMTMRYQVILRNNGPRSYRNLRVVAIQEYLDAGGLWSERIGDDFARDWFVEELRPGGQVVLSGEINIPYEGRSGLDQTHIQVQHWNKGQGKPGPGSVLIDDVQAGIWCPPAHKP